MQQIEFITRDYVYAHGRPPRGRGSWAFAFKPNGAFMDAFWSKPDATYAEAKKEAAAEARRRNVRQVWVLP